MSWFSKPKNIAITIGAGVLAVVVVVLLAVFIPRHTEDVLLDVCWSPTGKAIYARPDALEGASNGPCDRPEELVWPQKQIPLSVQPLSPEGKLLGADSDEIEAIESAIADVNAQVGFDLLRFADSSTKSPAIVARLGGAIEAGNPLGKVQHYRSNGPDGRSFHYRCDLWTSSRASGLRHEFLVVRHELLHCAGAVHSDDRTSVMYPFSDDDTMWDLMQGGRVRDALRGRLRELYIR